MVYFVDGQGFPGHKPTTGDEYKREATKFHLEGYPNKPVKLDSNRYHLIVSAACPWAHRAMLVRKLKDLSEITLSVVSPYRDDDHGWNFATDLDEEKYSSSDVRPTEDKASGLNFKYLHQIYTKSDTNYTGNITTPVLYDAKIEKIISNESWDIIRFLDRAFLPGPNAYIEYNLYPKANEKKTDSVGMWVQNGINNAVYKAGLSKSQKAYEEAVENVFDFLDEAESLLAVSRYLCSNNELSVADIQLVTTLLRFDDVYYLLFKCSKRRLRSYYNLTSYLRELYQMPGVASTVDMDQIKDHYYSNFTSANPNQVVPKGSSLSSFKLQHDRDKKFSPKSKEKTSVAIEEDQTNAASRRAKGEYVRGVSQQRRWITRDGDGDNELPAEKGRYHLYVANNCPWCHRTMMARAILGLEDVISVDVLFYRRDPDNGWQFLPDESELRQDELDNRGSLLDGKVATIDSINNHKYAPEIYKMVGSKEKSVPILFDKKTNTIVNNESAEIIRMFATGFQEFHRKGSPNLYPEEMAEEIDSLNAWIYPMINNGAYKAGFNKKQEVYEKAFDTYFEAFDRLEGILNSRRFLTGDNPTEADVRLFPTVVRHDPVYYSRFKLNKAMVLDYPCLNRWLQDMWNIDGVKEGTNIDHCVRGYFGRTGNNLIPMPSNGRWY